MSVLRWLGKIGLGDAASKFEELGITTPESLAELDLADFDLVGVTNEKQKKNLFLLIEGIRQCIKETEQPKNSGETENAHIEEQPETPRRSTRLAAKTRARQRPDGGLEEQDRRDRRRRTGTEAALENAYAEEKMHGSAPEPALGDSLTSSLTDTSESLPPPPPPTSSPPRSMVSVPSVTGMRLSGELDVDVGLGFSQESLESKISEASALEAQAQAEADAEVQIRVVVRKRPLKVAERDALKNSGEDAPSEEDARCYNDVICVPKGGGRGAVVVREPRVKVDLTRCVEEHSFRFDDAFDESDDTRSIYKRCMQQLVKRACEGGNATCFAYGQTGSGKTFTMLGNNTPDRDQSRFAEDPRSVTLPGHGTSVKSRAGDQHGLYILAAIDLFSFCEEQDVYITASFFEIYGSKLYDLLDDRNEVRALQAGDGGVHIVGLTEHTFENLEGLMDIMKKGNCHRSTGETAANEVSSRSHAVLNLNIRSFEAENGPGEAPYGRITFIDLAGSERGADTAAKNRSTRQEGAEINTSLLALKEVIRAIDKNQKHTPFRGSKLTQVLKDCFIGERTRTLMIACVAPDRKNCEHSLNTLRYADRVKEKDSCTIAADTALKENRRQHPNVHGPLSGLRAKRATLDPAQIPRRRPNRFSLAAKSQDMNPRQAVSPPPRSQAAKLESAVGQSLELKNGEGLRKPTLTKKERTRRRQTIVSKSYDVNESVSERPAGGDLKAESKLRSRARAVIGSSTVRQPTTQKPKQPETLEPQVEEKLYFDGHAQLGHEGKAELKSEKTCSEDVSDTLFHELVDAHRDVMQTLLGTTKEEMDILSLVDHTDDSGSAIEEYLDILETSLNDRSKLLKGLHDRVKTFQHFRGSRS